MNRTKLTKRIIYTKENRSINNMAKIIIQELSNKRTTAKKKRWKLTTTIN